LIRQFCFIEWLLFSYDGEVFENIDLREGEHDQIHMVDGRTLYIYSRQKNTGLLHNVVYIDFKKYVENRIFYIVSEEEKRINDCASFPMESNTFNVSRPDASILDTRSGYFLRLHD
jgi:hypothetical protein